MKRIVLAVGLLSLCGCAARVFEVRLAPPEVVAPVADVAVQDARLDPQIYMTGISMGSTSNIYLLSPKPPLHFMLQSFIQAKLQHASDSRAMMVRIERLDLKNKVGFAKADELYCEIESSVHSKGSIRVRWSELFPRILKTCLRS